MHFYYRITLAVAIICLFGHSGFGAPTTGRYIWVKCKPEDQNANCVTQMGPLVPLEGKSPRLQPSGVNDIFPVTTEETTPGMEELSGEGSGNPDVPKVTWMEGSGDINYPNFVHPEKKDELSEGDLKDENMIP